MSYSLHEIGVLAQYADKLQCFDGGDVHRRCVFVMNHTP